MKSEKPDALVHRIPLAMSSKMKAEVEKEATDLGISEQGFIRVCVRLYFKSGGLKPHQLGGLND